jgi:hypothetical protein
MMQVVLVRWRPRAAGRSAERLQAELAAATAPADRVAHVRVEEDGEEWRLVLFVHASTGPAALTAVEELVRRTAAVLPVRPERLDIELATAWFRSPG